VLGFSAASAILVALLLWLDVTKGLDERVAVSWQHLYERLAAALSAAAGIGPTGALLGAFAIVDIALVGMLFVCSYVWARSGLAASAYAWLPSWLAPIWVASGMSSGVFKSRAMAALGITSTNADGLQYERAWRLVQPEAFAFLAVGLAAGLLGWWLGVRHAAEPENARSVSDEVE